MLFASGITAPRLLNVVQIRTNVNDECGFAIEKTRDSIELRKKPIIPANRVSVCVCPTEDQAEQISRLGLTSAKASLSVFSERIRRSFG